MVRCDAKPRRVVFMENHDPSELVLYQRFASELRKCLSPLSFDGKRVSYGQQGLLLPDKPM